MAIDILTDTDGDLLIKNGDLVIGECDEQNLADLLDLNVGGDKDAPLAGCDIYRLVNGNNRQEVIGDIKLQLQADNWNQVQIIESELNVDVRAVRPE